MSAQCVILPPEDMRNIGWSARRGRKRDRIDFLADVRNSNDLTRGRVRSSRSWSINEKLATVEIETMACHPHVGRPGFQAALAIIEPIRSHLVPQLVGGV